MNHSDSSYRIEELVDRSRDGDPLACDRLLARYRPYLRLIAEQRFPKAMQQRDDESDIVQQTLVDAIRGLARFQGSSEAQFTAWLLKLLERNLLQTLRRNLAGIRDLRREVPFHASDGSAQLVWHNVQGNGSLPSVIFRGESALILAEALSRLPQLQRTAVECRYLLQMPLQEIALDMDKSVAAVAGLIRRGVEALREFLPDEAGEI